MKKLGIPFIASVELLGGILVIAGYATVATGGYEFNPQWQIVPATVFGVLALLAGILLFRNHRLGRPISIAVQVLQLVSISVVSHLRYVALAGPRVHLVIASNGVHLDFGGGGLFVAVPWSADGTLGALGAFLETGLSFAASPLAKSQFTIGINLAAALLLWRLVCAPQTTTAEFV